MKHKNLTFLSLLALVFSTLACQIPTSTTSPSETLTETLSVEMPEPETSTSTTQPVATFTPDSGVVLPTFPSPDIYQLTMFSETRGWAVTQDQNHLLVTEDGGETWLEATPLNLSALPAGYLTLGIRPFFLDEDTAWFSPYSDESTQIFHTIDGGVNWKYSDVPFENVTYTFIDQEVGYALVGLDAGAGSFYVAIYRTLNAGSSWDMVFTHEPGMSKSLRESGTKNNLSFVDMNHGWIGGSIPMDDYFYLFYTQDGGATWAEETDISLPVGFAGSILDVGQLKFFNTATAVLPVQAFTVDNTAFLLIYRSMDRGETWLYQGSVENGKTVSFISVDEGWSVAETTLYHTLDGGITWSALTTAGIPASEVFLQVDFVDNLHGWVLTTPDEMNMVPIHLYRTVDGGSTWVLLSP